MVNPSYLNKIYEEMDGSYTINGSGEISIRGNMNAYELADLNDWACCANSKEVSAMLRQQADRIAELEKQLQESAMNCISAYAQADDHYARVKELEAKVRGEK